MNKNCPNCGREVDANAKFCTYCGYRFAAQSSSSQVNRNDSQGSANPQPSQANSNNDGDQNPSQFEQDLKARSKEAKQFSNNYFQWLVATLKHPTKVPSDAHKYFGVTSFIISFVLIGIFIKVALKNVTDIVSTLMGSAAGLTGSDDGSALSGITASSEYSSAMNTIFNHLFIFFLIELVVITLIAFVIRKGIYHDHTSFLGFVNEFASYTNYALVIEVIAVVFLALNVFNVGSIVLFSLTLFAYSLASYYSIFKLSQSDGFDKIYSVLIGVVAQGLITYVLVTGFIY